MAEAHVDLIVDPSAPDSEGKIESCGSAACHPNEVAATANSLHTNLWGEIAAIEARGGAGCTVLGTDLEDKFNAKCATCHTTCGQCHVSRPNSVGGGFPVIRGAYRSHLFGEPDMNEQCTACHGSRIGVDYKGDLEGNTPDVHLTKGNSCKLCHTKDEIHGDGQRYNHRYEMALMPRCEDCHGDGMAQGWVNNTFHAEHVNGPEANLQCQVCHSQPYKNCTNCHNLVDDKVVEKYTLGEESVVQFKIAKNLFNQNRTEYDIVVVRHIPVDPGTYDDWGLSLTDYLDFPTWQYASPHNVIKNAPQTTALDYDPEVDDEVKTSCDTCHDTPETAEGFFLRLSDLEEGGSQLPDYNANTDIVLPTGSPSTW
ncbi:MAG: hypothetical protein KOO60_12525 [Gemmatimonadales bacterium]|nr:hypothetical protein [Gemmatimonadales bacterium]